MIFAPTPIHKVQVSAALANISLLFQLKYHHGT